MYPKQNNLILIETVLARTGLAFNRSLIDCNRLPAMLTRNARGDDSGSLLAIEMVDFVGY